MKKLIASMLVVFVLGSTTMSCFKNTVVTATEINTNLISNGNFNIDLTGWEIYNTRGGEGQISLDNNELKIDVDKCGEVDYSVQVSCGGFNLHKNGQYKLEFEVSSDIDRVINYRIQKNHGKYTSYMESGIGINNEKKSVSTDFIMNEKSDADPKLVFNVGKVQGEDLSKHSIKIDNIRLFLVDDSNVAIEEKFLNPEPKIVLNQIGYKNDDIKKVVFREIAGDEKFKVISDDTGEALYEGMIYGNMYNEAANEVNQFGDFSDLKLPGDYRIETDNLGISYKFKIGEDVYKELFDELFKFFYYQRCGEELTEEYAGIWNHKACHTEKARIYGTDEFIDVSGGWHDAGDYGRYTIAECITIADLLSAYNSNKEAFSDNMNIPESNNNIPDIFDEVKPQLQWLLKMQEPTSGGVYHKVTCAEFPKYISPELEKDELIISPISTTATGDFAAVMAMSYETFKDIDFDFAQKCLNAAEKAWTYLEATPNNGGFKNPSEILTGEYADPKDSDERYWAAAQLFKATNDKKYEEAFKKIIEQEGIQTGYGWIDVGYFGNMAYLYSKDADEKLCTDIRNKLTWIVDDIIQKDENDSYNIPLGTNYYWGNNMGILNDAILLVNVYKFNPKPEYLQYAKEHINYCLGKNSLGISFVTGQGFRYSVNPHHRLSIINEKAVPGMIVGGPNKDLQDEYVEKSMNDKPVAKRYIDNEESYSTNEVDIYWNSAFIYALSLIMMD